MKKQERLQKMKEGLKLYLDGMSKEAISKKLKISDKTVWVWSKQNKWEEAYEKMSNKVTEKIQDSVAEEKARTLKLISAIESLYAKQLQTGLEIKTSEFAQVQRVKWELLSPKNINQYNFMKQDIISPKFEFVIEDENKAVKKTT